MVCLIAMVCCTLWGSAFPGIKIGYALFGIDALDRATQILFAGCRFFIAGVLTVVLGSLINRRLLIPKRESWPVIFKLCLFQTVLQYLFFYMGLAGTSGVKASIITGTNTFWAILVASLIFRQEKLTPAKILGCVLGFAGVVIINLGGGDIALDFSLTGEGFILLSAISYAFSSVMMKAASANEDPVILSGYQFMAGGLIMVICGLLLGGRLTTTPTAGAGAILLYLGFLSAVAYSLWGILLKYNPVSKVAVFGFMTPVAGVALSALFLNENKAFGLTGLVALALVCAGIYVVNRHA